jgi:hypothetical protein
MGSILAPDLIGLAHRSMEWEAKLGGIFVMMVRRSLTPPSLVLGICEWISLVWVGGMSGSRS